ncbi:MAG: PhoH family protein [bacterium]
MIKNFVLDTNVLIHNPQSIYSFSDNNVIIPITVIEELDRFKNSSDKKGMHARQVLREIDALTKKGALRKGARMKNKGTFKISFGPKHFDLQNMDAGVNDNKIIAVAKELLNNGEAVFFISKDVNARIKAEALGIKARDYEKQKVEYAYLYKGWKEIQVKREDLNKLYEEGKLVVKSHTFLNNEHALVKAEEDPKSSAICKYDSVGQYLVPLKKEFTAMGIHPLNMEQRFAFDLLLDDNVKLVTLVGQAGTGKTLIAIACALSKTLGKHPVYEKLLVARPIIPMGKDIGYLPGSKDQKLNYWMQPIFDNLDFILKKAVLKKTDSSKKGNVATSEMTLDHLIQSDSVEIEALTYIRGRSIPHQFLIIDEAQNLTPHEIKTIISRAGDGTKIVLTGDPEQIDNPYLDANSNGLSYTAEKLKGQAIVGHIFLSKSERSELAALAVENL